MTFSKKTFVWFLILIPLLLIICGIGYFVSIIITPPLYDDMPYTSYNDVAAITEIQDFPAFDNDTIVRDGLFYEPYIRNLFRNEDDANKLMTKLEDKLSSTDNVYWTKDTLTSEEDIRFFGCHEVYICNRGWDGIYVKAPENIETYQSQVTIQIGKKGFTLYSVVCPAYGIEDYAVPDSLERLTGVKFPPHKFVNCRFYDMFTDYSLEATILLDTLPSRSFINSIGKAKNWYKLKNGIYEFRLDDRKGDSNERIYVNPKSQCIHLTCSTY